MADTYEEVEEPVVLDRTALLMLEQMKTMTSGLSSITRSLNQINGVKMTLSTEGTLSVTGGFRIDNGTLKG